MSEHRRKIVAWLAWSALALPGLAQLALLFHAAVARFAHPYDLEWMEGGLLAHAHRMSAGDGIYVAPSTDFIPYLYTPLYPGLVAALGGVFGISYQLGRAISILAMFGVVALYVAILLRDARPQPHESGEPPASDDRPVALVGAMLAAGFFAATYPWVDGWYDLVRADTLFLVMVLGGLHGLRVWARAGSGWNGHGRIAVAAAILGLSFFCKQTGVLFVAAGGAVLLVANWRRLPVYVGVTGVIGLGGTAMLNAATGGWFWTYVYEVHQRHDFNMDRFYKSFSLMLWKFPAMTLAIAVGLVVVAVTALMRRGLPRAAVPLLLWSWIFAVSCLVGALGWGTQWAHFNAYMPAMTTGALAAGAALVAVVACARRYEATVRLAPLLGGAMAAVLGIQLLMAWWSPAKLIPSDADVAAGDRLVERLRGIEGEVYVPFHPWYGHLAGKRMYVHRMGVMDVTYGNAWQVQGLAEALREARWDAIVWNDRPVDAPFARMRHAYRFDERFGRALSPRTVTGAITAPQQLWVPARPTPLPPDARALFDFEDRTYEGWTIEGRAWGRAPRSAPVSGQAQVGGYDGRYFADSMHGGDAATGTLTSPPFEIEGERITFRMSGGADPETLRAELHIDGTLVHRTANERPGEAMRTYEWPVAEHDGKSARIVLVDEATGSWGHLNVDHFVMWD